ncbi:centrosomal protein of 89 kDa isoform X3 [Hemicordylus capensis]|uniref:centrosomal protein of 89 kDa isoform X3 n=1 Tax=Hemicordylus capensis TaxID=884348 RepID=UPI002303D574|nr:centrosomal protein of 89 kDa isoform X3 [Hemicordylus capensis]XP_053127059.1 centrosomal protein of 89 kDa isoform X3 [Hemicordylus capensis]
MAFYFRRGRRGQFKHIAHGLVPAATIAPKPAVPRTPPPRSPNPSPERPRSALAAAILVTTLTGRTVAIPQPRQRSLSESDASCLQDQEGCIEPYATITELRMGPNWKGDGDERSVVQSFEVSGSYEDEDIDTCPSDIEKEPSPNCQVIDKKESTSSEALYAVPQKIKQENLPVSSSSDDEEEEPTCLIHPNVQVEEIARSEANFQVEKLAIEHSVSEKLPPSPDAAVRRKQVQMELAKERFQKLQEENWHLDDANRTLFSQLEETKQHVKELQLKVKELETENRRFKETAQDSRSEEELAELLSLRQQGQELVDENYSLKMTVHRLNVELSRYQAKYRPISPNESLKIGSLPLKKPIPPWLLDMKYLSPLLLAYEDRMRGKEDLILAHEEDMKNFKAQVEEIVKENEQLHQQLSKNGSFTTKEWQQLQSQAKLVLEENVVLMEQLKIQHSKARDNHNQHTEDVSKLTKQLMILEAKKHSQEEELRDSQKQLDVLHSTYKELKATFRNHITMKEHVALVEQLKSQLQQEQEKKETELQELIRKLGSVQAEKKSLLIEKKELEAQNKVLESELETVQKTKRQLQDKIGLLKQQLDKALEKEMTAHQYLTGLVSLAEKISQERDHLLNLTSSLENEKQGVLQNIIKGNVRLGKLEEKVKVYKKTAAGKLGDISLKMTEQEKEFAGKAAQYQREMKHLQRLLQEKQETLDEVLQQKREMEGELEIIWESTTKENRRMKELLHKSLEKKNTQSPVKAYESLLADISPKDLLGFSICVPTEEN